MKIVCDACQAKYSIADDKIQGKAFKIRCKKCNHIIVVKVEGDAGAHAAGAPANAPEKPKAAAPAPGSAEQGVWHVVVDGEQVGPLTEAEVKDRLSQGKINSDTLVWKDGLGDWTALSTVPELAAIYAKVAQHQTAKPAARTPASPTAAKAPAPSAPAARPSGSHSAHVSHASMPDVDVFAPSPAASPASHFGAPSPAVSPVPATSPASAPSSAFLFGASPAHAPEPAAAKTPGNGAGGTHLTGQRNENSVLFSLSNLEALAVPTQSAGVRPPSGTSNTEGSGLIDIRSMAAMTLGDAGESRRTTDSLPTFSTPQFSPVAPVILPISNSGPPKWVYPVLGVLGVAILVVSIVIYKVVSAPPPGAIPMVVAPPPVAAPVAAPTPTPPTGTEPVAVAPEAAKPAVPPPPTATEEKKPSDKGDKSRRGDKGRHKGDQAASSKSSGESKESKKEVAVAAPPPPPPLDLGKTGASKPSGKKGDKSLDDLLGEVGNKKRGGDDSSAKSSANAQAKLISLTQSDIVNAMKGVQPKVQACANQFKVPGTALAQISVASGGRISGATVTGKFAGTPTGSCVEQAAKSAKLPACTPMNFPWPFTLTPR